MNSRSPVGCALLLLTVSLGANSAVAQAKPLTAREVVARIQGHAGIPWMQRTVDTFKAGNPDAEVKGIAVTMMATLDGLQRAATAGQNLIITHEPTFFNHQDKPDELEQKDNDPVLAAKRAFIEQHGLVISRPLAPDAAGRHRNGNGACFGMGNVSRFQQSISFRHS